MGYKLLVLGGSGFIGSHVARRGIKNGFETFVLSKRIPPKSEIIEGVNYINLDISHKIELKKIFNISFHYIVNLSGDINHSPFFKSGNEIIDIHFNSIVNLIFHLKKDKLIRFVQIGSSDEYGDNIAPQHEAQIEKPFSTYSFAKSATTNFIKYLFKSENFPGTILRPFIIYGPGQKTDRLIPYVIKKAINNEKFPVSSGKQIRDFLYVDDAVEAIFLALENDLVNGRLINIGSGEPRSVKSIIEKIIKEIGSGNPIYGDLKIRDGENLNLYPNVELAKKLLNWESKISIDSGLKKVISFFEK